MDEFAWAIVIARCIPFVVWSFVVSTSPRAVGREDRYRRLLVVRLVWGATAAMLFGSLAAVGLVPRDLGTTVYTAYSSILAIVGAVLLWNYWRPGR